jgi:uncharacterized delta-60 repeat protein
VAILGLLLLLAIAVPGAVAKTAVRLDPSFGGRGLVLSKGFIGGGLAEDRSGRLVVVGGTEGGFAAARYLPDGRLDPSFGKEGIAHLDLSVPGSSTGGESAEASALAIQPDGKILIGGSYDPNLSVHSDLEVVLARLNSDGTLDSGFGGTRVEGGRPGEVIAIARKSLRAITLQGGKILVGGQGAQGGYVARYNPDGTRDKSFASGNAGGQAHISTGKNGNAEVSGLLALHGGSVYAAGSLNGNFMLARLTRNGALDPSFGARGVVKTNAAGRAGCGCSLAQGLARDPRGRLMVSGFVTAFGRRGSPRAIAVARYNADGALDGSFAQQGIARTSIGGETSGGKVAVQRDGRIVVAGSSAKAKGGPTRFTLVRYRQDGSRDRSFFADGVFTASFGARGSSALQPLIERSGRVVVLGGASGGSGEARTLVARFTTGR